MDIERKILNVEKKIFHRENKINQLKEDLTQLSKEKNKLKTELKKLKVELNNQEYDLNEFVINDKMLKLVGRECYIGKIKPKHKKDLEKIAQEWIEFLGKRKSYTLWLRVSGKSNEEIATELQISKARVGQILSDIRKYITHPKIGRSLNELLGD